MTTPLDASIVATPVEALLHVPLPVALARVVVSPLQTVVFPVIGVDTETAITVIVADELFTAVQPLFETTAL